MRAPRMVTRGCASARRRSRPLAPAAGRRILALATLSLHFAVGAPVAANSVPAPARFDVDVAGFEGDFTFVPLTVNCEGDVKVWQAGEDPRAGASAAGLSFSITAGKGSVGVGGDIPLPGRVEAIRLWVRGDASGRAVSARVQDAGGETHVVPLGRADFAGWRRLEAPVRDGGAHYGGDGDGHLSFPARVTSICVDGLEPGSAGVLYFDALSTTSLLTPAEQVSFTLAPSGPHAVLDPGKREALLKARSYLPHPTTVEYSWQLSDLSGGKAGAGTGSFGVSPAAAAEQKMVLPDKRLGSYILTATARAPGLPPCRLRLDLAIVPPPSRSVVQESRLGLNIPGALDEVGRSLARLSGAGWVRVPIRWADIEKTPGRYVVDVALEDTLTDLSRAGIRILPVLWSENTLYPPGEGRTKAWSQWCREMARRWGGRHHIRHWEVACPAPGTARGAALAGSYAGVLAAAGAAIAEVDEEARVVAAAPITGGDVFLGDVVRAAGEEHVGGVSTQWVCTVPAGRLPSLMCRVPSLLTTPRKPPRLLISTLKMDGPEAAGDTELGRAGNLAGALLAAMVDPCPDAVLLPGLKESNPRGAVPDGLVRSDLSPTPAFAAYRTLAGLLAGLRFQAGEDESFASFSRFERRGSAVLAYRSRIGETTFALETDAPKVTWSDLSGNTRELAASDGVALVPASPLPGFLRLPGAARARLHPILIPPAAPVAVRRGGSAAARVLFRNPFRGADLGVLRLFCPPGWRGHLDYPAGVGRGGQQSLALSVTPSPETPPGRYSVRVALELAPGAGAPIAVEVPFRVDAGTEGAPAAGATR